MTRGSIPPTFLLLSSMETVFPAVPCLPTSIQYERARTSVSAKPIKTVAARDSFPGFLGVLMCEPLCVLGVRGGVGSDEAGGEKGPCSELWGIFLSKTVDMMARREGGPSVALTRSGTRPQQTTKELRKVLKV